jgi:thioesterase domain-containing protein
VYRTADGELFEIVFAADAEVPGVWVSPKSSQEGVLLDSAGEPVESEIVETKIPRSHWDMLLERRTRAELEELLQERLDVLRARRGVQKIGA